MSKSKESKPSEFYLGEIRRLKAENRNLKKRIRQLEKSEIMHDSFTGDEDDDNIQVLPIGNSNNRLPEICPDCSKGYLIEKNLIGRIYDECSTCGYRSSVKRHEKPE